MDEVTKIVTDQFKVMGSIHSVVYAAMNYDPGENDYTFPESLESMGQRLAEVLGLYTNEHDPGWIVKKAHDSIRTFLDKTLYRELNLAMGLPEDFTG